MQLHEFKDSYIDLLLQFLWRQWSALGVAGYAEGGDNWVIDPEALLSFSATIARYDQRLFDEILDWLDKNERFINVQRLRTILKQEGYISSDVLSAIAALIMKNKSGIKWKGLARSVKTSKDKQRHLFYLKSGKPVPVVGEKDPVFGNYGFERNPVQNRGMSGVFPVKQKTSLLLQLRSFLGISSRSETLCYLLIKGRGTIQEIADQTYYAWRSIQDVLFEMGHSGMLSFSTAKKGRFYYIDNEPWLDLFLKNKDERIQWICWPPLFRALELIWLKLNETGLFELSRLEQAAVMRELMSKELDSRFEKAGTGMMLGDLTGYYGEEYLDAWLENMRGFLG
jgi:hypothetical protein